MTIALKSGEKRSAYETMTEAKPPLFVGMEILRLPQLATAATVLH